MFSHVHVGVSDFARSFSFYQTVLGELGLELSICRPEQSWAGWSEPGVERPLFFIGLPFDRKPVQSGNGHMTAFLALTRTTVDRCHAAALRCGGVCDGPPGPRPQYHSDFYGAYFRDPDGNKICVCSHSAPAV
jgi:catechol 2,3-dioxygenase-like lactoylglutathione lyase family enzyme